MVSGAVKIRVLDSPTAPRFARALHRALSIPGRLVKAEMHPWEDGEHYFRPTGPTLRGITVVLPWTINLDTQKHPHQVAQSIAGLGVAVDACARMRVREVIVAMPHLDDPSGEVLQDFVERFAAYGDKVVLMRLDPDKPEKDSSLSVAQSMVGEALLVGKVVRTIRRERTPITGTGTLAKMLRESMPVPDFVIGTREYRQQTEEFARALFGESTPRNTVIALLNFGQRTRGRAIELQRATLPGVSCVVFLPRATNPAPVRRIGQRLRAWDMKQVHLAVVHPTFLPGSAPVLEGKNPFDSLFALQTFEDPDPIQPARRLFNVSSVVSPAHLFAVAIRKHLGITG